MNSQGKLFKASALTAAVSAVLAIVLYFFLATMRGDAGNVLFAFFLLLLIASVAATLIALPAFQENGRKPGSTPLIFAVIALPTGLILMAIGIPTMFLLLFFLGVAAILTGVVALIIGLVKKLAVKTA
jgi:uncharacterized membrane protein HdeD (DUF308 family)